MLHLHVVEPSAELLPLLKQRVPPVIARLDPSRDSLQLSSLLIAERTRLLLQTVQDDEIRVVVQAPLEEPQPANPFLISPALREDLSRPS
ncbi:hypothetical protein ACWGIB_04980 [Streptomyces xiamenensis]